MPPLIEKTIVLKTLEDVRNFTFITSEKPYDIELLSGKYIVNAKSVMGILSLDLTQPLKMVADTDTNSESILLGQIKCYYPED